VYLAAGVVRMPFRRFLLWDLACATIVVSVFFALSYSLGAYLDRETIGGMVRHTEMTITAIVLVLAVGAVAYFALRRHRRRLLVQVLDPGKPPVGDEAPATDAREAS
jgi:membrane protein DedA with SNARE-associated domain